MDPDQKATDRSVLHVAELVRAMMADEDGPLDGEDLFIVAGQQIPTRDGNGSLILVEYAIGDPGSWHVHHDSNARTTFSQTARTGLTSLVVQSQRPDLIDLDRDGVDWGSAIKGNCVAACSGVQPWWCVCFAEMIVSAMFADIYGQADVLRSEVRKKGKVHLRDA